MKTVILAGGFGSRLAEETEARPKPMVEIGERPILWHIMMHYASHGFREFVVALGYKGDFVKHWFADYANLRGNLTVSTGTGEVKRHGSGLDDWTVDLVETGLKTQTGGRIKRLRPWIGEGTFMATHGDGVSDVDLRRLLAFHKSHGRLATLTAVRPRARFGHLELEGDLVKVFTEKPEATEGWINGGFWVLEPGVFDYIAGDMTHFEYEPLSELAADGQLVAYRHTSFWQCMDTLREKKLLERLWESGSPPWTTRV